MEKVTWQRGGVLDLEAWFLMDKQEVWVGLIPDGGLQRFQEAHQNREILGWSCSGRFYAAGPLQVDHEASPVDVLPLLRGWGESAPAHLDRMLGSRVEVEAYAHISGC